MIEYRFVENEDESVVTKRVAELLNQGWHCQGGISVAVYRGWSIASGEDINRWWYAQAMVKDDHDQP